MVTTCFSCQNLISDFIEGILPAARHEEIKSHIEQCEKCHQIHREVMASIAILRQLPAPEQPPEFSVRIVEASESGKTIALRPAKISRFVLTYALPVLGLISVLVVSSKVIPWMDWIKTSAQERDFVRYFPMSNGASEIIDEQAAWIHSREPKMGSLWEEGGISSDEFEKAFQKKGGANEFPE